MFLINQLTSAPLQSQSITLPDSTVLNLEIYFRPMQYGWFINQLTYKDFVLCGMRIVNSPNMLLQYQNIIPFGLACYSINNREPSLQEDFSSGSSQLFILDSLEVAAFYDFLQTGVL